MKKALGIIHIVFALLIGIQIAFDSIPFIWAFIACLYFIGKGILFGISKGSVLSYLDAIAGFILILAVTDVFSNIVITAIVMLFLLEKGVSYLLR